MAKTDRPAYDYTTGEGQRRMFYDAHDRLHGHPAGTTYDRTRRTIDTTAPGDYGCDPLGDGTFRMIPSGDVVNADEMRRRLGR